jgi:hypothetical protein
VRDARGEQVARRDSPEVRVVGAVPVGVLKSLQPIQRTASLRQKTFLDGSEILLVVFARDNPTLRINGLPSVVCAVKSRI